MRFRFFKITILLPFILGGTTFVSCQRMELSQRPEDVREEIRMVFHELPDAPDTRVTAINNSSDLNNATIYWHMTSGTYGDEQSQHSGSFTFKSGITTYNTGQYRASSGPVSNYYVTNRTAGMSYLDGSVVMTGVSNDQDVMVGRMSTDVSDVDIIMEHIFTRLGELSLNAPSGYTVSVSQWEIEGATGSGTAGTYNLSTQTWSSVTALAKRTVSASGDDLYLVPGNYKIYVRYTISKSGWSKEYYSSATVTLDAGKVNDITGSVNASVNSVTFGITPQEWGPLHTVVEES